MTYGIVIHAEVIPPSAIPVIRADDMEPKPDGFWVLKKDGTVYRNSVPGWVALHELKFSWSVRFDSSVSAEKLLDNPVTAAIRDLAMKSCWVGSAHVLVFGLTFTASALPKMVDVAMRLGIGLSTRVDRPACGYGMFIPSGLTMPDQAWHLRNEAVREIQDS